MTLLEKCNADVFAAILKYKEERPLMGQKVIDSLQSKEHWTELSGREIIDIYCVLPKEIWNGSVWSMHNLFQSQQTTEMP